MTAPLERDEQKALAAWLDAIGVCWLHIPNESPGGDQRKLIAWRQQLKRLGVKKGAPDVICFTPPPILHAFQDGPYRGAAIELKRKGATVSMVTDEQHQWLADLERLGWATSWQPGAAAAIKWLEGLGYGRTS